MFDTLLKVLPSLLPTEPIATIAATAMRAAIRPYSMAVAPDSFDKNDFANLVMFILLSLECALSFGLARLSDHLVYAGHPAKEIYSK